MIRTDPCAFYAGTAAAARVVPLSACAATLDPELDSYRMRDRLSSPPPMTKQEEQVYHAPGCHSYKNCTVTLKVKPRRFVHTRDLGGCTPVSCMHTRVIARRHISFYAGAAITCYERPLTQDERPELHLSSVLRANG